MFRLCGGVASENRQISITNTYSKTNINFSYWHKYIILQWRLLSIATSHITDNLTVCLAVCPHWQQRTLWGEPNYMTGGGLPTPPAPNPHYHPPPPWPTTHTHSCLHTVLFGFTVVIMSAANKHNKRIANYMLSFFACIACLLILSGCGGHIWWTSTKHPASIHYK